MCLHLYCMLKASPAAPESCTVLEDHGTGHGVPHCYYSKHPVPV